jgi:hypothetical protein
MKNYLEKNNEELLWEEQWRKSSSPWTWHLLPSGERIVRPRKKLVNQDTWSQRLKKSKIEEMEDWRSRSFKKLKFQAIKYWRSQKIEEVEDLMFGDSTWVCDSSRVSGATDMGMPFGYPRISIPGPAHYGGRQVEGLEKMTWRQRRKVLISIRLGHL